MFLHSYNLQRIKIFWGFLILFNHYANARAATPSAVFWIPYVVTILFKDRNLKIAPIAPGKMFWSGHEGYMYVANSSVQNRYVPSRIELDNSSIKTLSRALDPRANGAWLSKLTQ